MAQSSASETQNLGPPSPDRVEKGNWQVMQDDLHLSQPDLLGATPIPHQFFGCHPQHLPSFLPHFVLPCHLMSSECCFSLHCVKIKKGKAEEVRWGVHEEP